MLLVWWQAKSSRLERLAPLQSFTGQRVTLSAPGPDGGISWAASAYRNGPFEEIQMSNDVAVGLPGEVAMSLSEIAKHLPLSEAKLREIVRQGTIPATRVGRIYYMFASDVKASPLGALWR